MRKYNELLLRLDVKESATCSDALAVLQELAESVGSKKLLVDPDTQIVVLECWKMLDRGLGQGQVSTDQLKELRTQRVICAPHNVLVPPERLFLDDRPGLKEKFGEFLQNSVIPRKLETWRAMEAAGVRALSEAVESQFVETTDPVEDLEILRRSTERRESLTRVLDCHRSGLAEKLGHLVGLRCVAAKELKVTYTVRAYDKEESSPAIHSPRICINEVRAYDKEESSPAEGEQAHFGRADNTLYFARRDGQPPWTAVARELAAVLSPKEEKPVQLASFIKDVLSPDDAQAVKAMLDELGMPDLAPVDVTPESAPAAEIGVTSESPADSELPPPASTITSQSSGHTDSGGHSDSDYRPSIANRPQDEKFDPIAALLGGNIPGPTPLPGDLDQSDRPTSTRPDTRTGTSGTSSTPRGDDGDERDGHGDGRFAHATRGGVRSGNAVLRTYVKPDRPDDSSPTDDEGQAQREETDQVGVNRVLHDERKKGRTAREMPPNHPEYNVVSSNGSTNIERYIVVKSLSDDWRLTGVAMTKTQFAKASELGDRYWLYIVERAQQDDFQLYCIQDPAGKANRFMFDSGWKQVADGTLL